MRKKTTRREAMTVGLGAVVLGGAGEAAATKAAARIKNVGHHYKHGDLATFHIVGEGTNWKSGKVKVQLKGTTAAGKTVTWDHDPSKQEVIDATRIKVKSKPTWDKKKDDPEDKDGSGSLTVTVTNDDGTNKVELVLQDVSYI
jgi:hypothetical protein